jgi:hypothetical protein
VASYVKSALFFGFNSIHTEAKRMRILRNLALGAASVILLYLFFAVMANHWYKMRMHFPSPENASAFLRTYSLKKVVEPYIAPPGGSGEVSGSGGGAGINSVKHHANFAEYFTMRSEQKQALMETVDHDLAQQLRTSGAQSLSHNGVPSTGIQFRYRSGNSIGSVAIHPLAPGRVQRNLALDDGLEDVALTIDIEEEWFPSGIPAEVAHRLLEPGT